MFPFILKVRYGQILLVLDFVLFGQFWFDLCGYGLVQFGLVLWFELAKFWEGD